MAKSKIKKEQIEHDIQWKAIIIAYFFSFIRFFLPELYPFVDFSKKPEFLDKELYKLMKDKLKGKRITDLLVKIYLKDGTEKWLLFHIEVQEYYDKIFGKRMFTIYYRIVDRYDKNPVALAIFTSRDNMPASYENKHFGTEICYKYNAYYIINQDEEELLKSDNVFALAVLACLYLAKSKKKNQQLLRYEYKRKLMRLMLERGYDKIDIHQIFVFIQNIMKISPELQEKLEIDIEKHLKMETISPITEDNKRLAIRMYKSLFGVNPQEAVREAEKRAEEESKRAEEEAKRAEKESKRAEEESKRAEEEAKRAEEEAKRAEEEAKRAEEEAKRAEEEAKRAEEEAKRAKEEEKENTIVSLYTNLSLTIEQIAKGMNLKDEFIKKVLEKKGFLNE